MREIQQPAVRHACSNRRRTPVHVSAVLTRCFEPVGRRPGFNQWPLSGWPQQPSCWIKTGDDALAVNPSPPPPPRAPPSPSPPVGPPLPPLPGSAENVALGLVLILVVNTLCLLLCVMLGISVMLCRVERRGHRVGTVMTGIEHHTPAAQGSAQAEAALAERQERESWLQPQLARLPTYTYMPASGEEDDEECILCLESFVKGDCVRSLPCFHKFHKECVDRWLLGAEQQQQYRLRVCPICKADPLGPATDPLGDLGSADGGAPPPAAPSGAVLGVVASPATHVTPLSPLSSESSLALQGPVPGTRNIELQDLS